MAICDTPDLGRIQAVGLFLLDDCMAPLYEQYAGYIDDCPAAVETSDNQDDGDEFTRRCANGTIKRYLPGIKSLQSIEVSVDLHWIDPGWVANANAASPIVHDGEIVGWGDGTQDRFNVLIVVWQEILNDSCATPGVAGSSWVRMYPVKGARITEEGTIGGEDNYIRITGETVDAHEIGSGPIELARDAATGAAEWFTDCFEDGVHRYRFEGALPPTDCGPITTIAPGVPCTPAS